jgi:hypothetical protein
MAWKYYMEGIWRGKKENASMVEQVQSGVYLARCDGCPETMIIQGPDNAPLLEAKWRLLPGDKYYCGQCSRRDMVPRLLKLYEEAWLYLQLEPTEDHRQEVLAGVCARFRLVSERFRNTVAPRDLALLDSAFLFHVMLAPEEWRGLVVGWWQEQQEAYTKAQERPLTYDDV